MRSPSWDRLPQTFSTPPPLMVMALALLIWLGLPAIIVTVALLIVTPPAGIVWFAPPEEVRRGGVEHRTARVGVGGGEVDVAAAGEHESGLTAGRVVDDTGIDRQRAFVVVDVQRIHACSGTAGGHATVVRRRTDGVAEVPALEKPSRNQVQGVGPGREGDVGITGDIETVQTVAGDRGDVARRRDANVLRRLRRRRHRGRVVLRKARLVESTDTIGVGVAGEFPPRYDRPTADNVVGQ